MNTFEASSMSFMQSSSPRKRLSSNSCLDRHKEMNVLKSKQSSDGQTCIENVPERKRNYKLMKRSINRYTQHVTFAVEDVCINEHIPYVAGVSDAEVIRLHQNDIWYTKKDYTSFMQDRIDTIRVYRSVNGNMTGLHDYYCTHGLEHFLMGDQRIDTYERSLERSITPGLTDHQFQKTSRPTCTLPSKYLPLFSDHSVQTLNNAITKMIQSNDTAPEKGSVTSAGESSTAANESILESCKFGLNVDDINKIELYGGILLPSPTVRTKMHPVDINSLRMMNMEFLKKNCSKSDSKAKSHFSTTADTEISASRAFLNMSCSVTVHDTIRTLELNAKSDFSGRTKADFNSTMLNVMNRALEISSVCVDPVSSLNATGTIEVPATISRKQG